MSLSIGSNIDIYCTRRQRIIGYAAGLSGHTLCTITVPSDIPIDAVDIDAEIAVWFDCNGMNKIGYMKTKVSSLTASASVIWKETGDTLCVVMNNIATVIKLTYKDAVEDKEISACQSILLYKDSFMDLDTTNRISVGFVQAKSPLVLEKGSSMYAYDMGRFIAIGLNQSRLTRVSWTGECLGLFQLNNSHDVCRIWEVCRYKLDNKAVLTEYIDGNDNQLVTDGASSGGGDNIVYIRGYNEKQRMLLIGLADGSIMFTFITQQGYMCTQRIHYVMLLRMPVSATTESIALDHADVNKLYISKKGIDSNRYREIVSKAAHSVMLELDDTCVIVSVILTRHLPHEGFEVKHTLSLVSNTVSTHHCMDSTEGAAQIELNYKSLLRLSNGKKDNGRHTCMDVVATSSHQPMVILLHDNQITVHRVQSLKSIVFKMEFTSTLHPCLSISTGKMTIAAFNDETKESNVYVTPLLDYVSNPLNCQCSGILLDSSSSSIIYLKNSQQESFSTPSYVVDSLNNNNEHVSFASIALPSKLCREVLTHQLASCPQVLPRDRVTQSSIIVADSSKQIYFHTSSNSHIKPTNTIGYFAIIMNDGNSSTSTSGSSSSSGNSSSSSSSSMGRSNNLWLYNKQTRRYRSTCLDITKKSNAVIDHYDQSVESPEFPQLSGAAALCLSVAWSGETTLLLLTKRRSYFCLEILSREATKQSLAQGNPLPAVHKIILLPCAWVTKLMDVCTGDDESSLVAALGDGNGQLLIISIDCHTGMSYNIKSSVLIDVPAIFNCVCALPIQQMKLCVHGCERVCTLVTLDNAGAAAIVSPVSNTYEPIGSCIYTDLCSHSNIWHECSSVLLLSSDSNNNRLLMLCDYEQQNKHHKGRVLLLPLLSLPSVHMPVFISSPSVLCTVSTLVCKASPSHCSSSIGRQGYMDLSQVSLYYCIFIALIKCIQHSADASAMMTETLAYKLLHSLIVSAKHSPIAYALLQQSLELHLKQLVEHMCNRNIGSTNDFLALTQALYAVDSPLLIELVSCLSRKLDPVTCKMLFPVLPTPVTIGNSSTGSGSGGSGMHTMQLSSMHSSLSLYEYCLQHQYLLHALRLLTVASEHVSSPQGCDPQGPRNTLKMAMELTSKAIDAGSLLICIQSIEFALRLEGLLCLHLVDDSANNSTSSTTATTTAATTATTTSSANTTATTSSATSSATISATTTTSATTTAVRSTYSSSGNTNIVMASLSLLSPVISFVVESFLSNGSSIDASSGGFRSTSSTAIAAGDTAFISRRMKYKAVHQLSTRLGSDKWKSLWYPVAAAPTVPTVHESPSPSPSLDCRESLNVYAISFTCDRLVGLGRYMYCSSYVLSLLSSRAIQASLVAHVNALLLHPTKADAVITDIDDDLVCVQRMLQLLTIDRVIVGTELTVRMRQCLHVSYLHQLCMVEATDVCLSHYDIPSVIGNSHCTIQTITIACAIGMLFARRPYVAASLLCLTDQADLAATLINAMRSGAEAGSIERTLLSLLLLNTYTASLPSTPLSSAVPLAVAVDVPMDVPVANGWRSLQGKNSVTCSNGVKKVFNLIRRK